MSFSLAESDNWGSDNVQAKFIKQYYEAPKVQLKEKGNLKKQKKKNNETFTISQEIQKKSDSYNRKYAEKKQNKAKESKNESNQTQESPNKNSLKRKYSLLNPDYLRSAKKMKESDVQISKDNIDNKKTKKKRRKKNKRIQNIDDDNSFNCAIIANNKIAKTTDTASKLNSSNFKSTLSQRSHLLKEKALKTMQAAKFRLLNEKLYTETGKDASNFFRNDSQSFYAYHEGYQNQVSKWPVNPVDLIIKEIFKYPSNWIIADLGCGEAKIARTFHKRKIHSFDLVSMNNFVISCDIAKVPLADNAVDVAIFCLSLMGTNLKEYILEARRIIKINGILKIAEVESRFDDDVTTFIKNIEAYGFTLINKNESHKMFVLMDFKKVRCSSKTSAPDIYLNPCIYKKR